MNLSTKKAQTYRHEEQIVVSKGEGSEGGMDCEFGIIMETIIYKMDKQQGPTVLAQGTIFNIL